MSQQRQNHVGEADRNAPPQSGMRRDRQNRVMAFETTMRLGGAAWSCIAFASSALFLIGFPNSCAAQAAARDAVSDANEARIDALLATPSLSVPAPQANLFATAPGLEEQAPAPRSH
jgi:hypothetical protein